MTRIQSSPLQHQKRRLARCDVSAKPRRSNTRTSHCARWAQAAATAACNFKLSSRNVAYLIGWPNLWMPRVMCTHACVIAIRPWQQGTCLTAHCLHHWRAVRADHLQRKVPDPVVQRHAFHVVPSPEGRCLLTLLHIS